MIKYLRLLLLPFSLLYGIVIILRNKFYDRGLLKSVRFDIPVICVGNLVVGGSGKSPVTEHLVTLLSGYRIAILSRGYGRETKGFFYADENSTARSVGDEPLQFYHKFPEVTVAVCEDRVYGIQQLQDAHDVIILDDAFQHRRVRPGFSILLFDYYQLSKPQFLLPAGNLREPFRGYKRADLLLVTKAPEQLQPAAQEQLRTQFNGEQVFFSSIRYGKLTGLFSKAELELDSLKGKTVFLLTGIANPKPLVLELKRHTQTLIHHDHPDHHSYTLQDLKKLAGAFLEHPAKEKIIITTEKDSQRLFDVTFRELLLNLPVFYLPIQITVQTDSQNTFNQKILTYVSDTSRDRRIYKKEK